MPKDGGVKLAESAETFAPVLMVGLGRGGGGKSTMLAEAVWRAIAQGRHVLVADGDARSKTLSALFPDAIAPASEEMPEIKQFLSGLLNRMAKDCVSVALDLGAGDRALLEFGRELRMVEFCQRRGIEPLAAYCLGPEEEDLSHISTIFDAGYFRPKRSVLFLSEGVIRAGQHVAGAFDRTLKDPRFYKMVEAGARPIMVKRLACMGQIKGNRAGFYSAAAGNAGLDPVEEFMVMDWCEDLEKARSDVGVCSWMP